MSREEYLNQLHKYLRKLPRQEYEDAMEYFTEYFQETDEEGTAELMKELGTPKEAARDLMANLLDKKIEDHQNYEADGQTRAEQKGSGKHVDRITGVICSTGGSSASGSPCSSCSFISRVCICSFVMCGVVCSSSADGWWQDFYPRYTGSSVLHERLCNAYRKRTAGYWSRHSWCTVMCISV